MALNKLDQVRFDGLQQTLNMLVASSIPMPQIKVMMAPQIADFEASSNHKLRFVVDGDQVLLSVVNMSKDFVRVRGVEDAKVLRTKIIGVPIDVKITKADEYSFSNEAIVEALRALADKISFIGVEVNTLDITADVGKGTEASEDAVNGEEDDDLEPTSAVSVDSDADHE